MAIVSRTLGIAMITAVCAALICSTAVQADPPGKERAARPAPAKPWGQVAPSNLERVNSSSSVRRAMGGSGSGVQSGADHVMNQQCVDDGWGWPHASCSTTFHNITAPIAGGLLQAYEITADPLHLASAKAAGDFDLLSAWPTFGEARFGTFAAGFMFDLSQATGDSTYSTFAEVQLFDELTAGTYGDNDWDTAGFITAIEVGRTGTWVNLRPWEFRTLGLMAATIGNAGQQALFNQGVLDGLNTLDNTDPATVFSDLIGLSGGVEGLALNGTTSFTAIVSPLHSGIDGVSSLCDLAAVLISFQNVDGSWNWHSDLSPFGGPTEGDKDTQTTAYAVLALLAAQDAGCGPYTTEIDLARGWLWSMQDVDGGFSSWPGGTHNVEVEGEVLMAMLPPDEVFVDDDFCDGCANDGHQWGFDAFNNIQDGINAVGASIVNVAAGTYTAQVVIDKSLALLGAGAGVSIIEAPDPLTADGDGFFHIVTISGAGVDVELTGFTITGPGPGGCATIHSGIFVRDDANGNIHDNTIADVRDDPFSGCQNGIGILIGRDFVGTDGTATLTDNTLVGYQKGGIVVDGAGSSADIIGNSVTGIGDTVVTAQNGIQVSRGASATIEGNAVSDHLFTVGTFASTGLLFFEASSVDVTNNNQITDNFPGAFFQDSSGTFDGNTISNPTADPGDGFYAFNTAAGFNGGGKPRVRVAPFDGEGSSRGPKGRTTSGAMSVTVTNSEFIGHDLADSWGVAAFSNGPVSVLNISNSVVRDWDWGIVAFDFGGPVDITAANNAVFSNVTFGFSSNVADRQDASGNWWGTNDPAAVAAQITGDVDYTPWLDTGVDTGDPGFQGDFSTLHVDDDSPQTGATTRIQEGLDLVSGSTINVAPGTYVESGQIVIASDVNIIGDTSSNPVIMTDQDTGSSGDARGWWLVNAGITLVMENLVLDGTGFKVWQGIRSHGTLTATNCTFREIKFDASGPSYAGTAMTNFDFAAGPGTLTATDCTFTEIGRIGIHAFGPAVIERCTYTGKGAGDHLDYFACVGSFGASIGQATINSCTVTNNIGVASVDGSVSGGILVSTFFDPGTTATVTHNVVTGNTVGLAVGFDTADTSTVVANFNQFSGNDFGLFNAAPSNQINAESNWWGDADGPEHADDGNADDVEIDLATCDTVSVDNMKNELPGGSLGNSVSEGADFCPWLEGAGSLVLLASDCQDDTSGAVGNQIEVELRMLDLSQAATGFQAFVEYSPGSLSYRGDLSSYTSDPFALHITGINQTDDGLLDLDGSVGFSPPQDPTKGNALLATLVFDVLAECGVETVNFEVGGAFGSEISLEGIPLPTNLENVAFVSDDTDPVITTCPTDPETVECDGAGNAADIAAWRATFAATDNCGVTLTDDFTALSNGCGATGEATVTFTATDDCGNFDTCTSTFIVADTTNPSINTAASNMTVECDGAGNGAQFSAWLASNGGASASDICGGVTWSNSSVGLSDLCGATGAETVTFTATDDCGNFSTTVATFTIADTVAPTIANTPASFDINADAGGCSALVTYTAPTASDDCDANPVVTCVPASGTVFDEGLTPVTCTAVDACTNSDAGSEWSFDVTVNSVNDVVIDIQLAGVIDASTRCIHFTSREAGDVCGLTDDVELAFDGTGLFSGTVEISCGPWASLCVKDEQHTLYDTSTLTAGNPDFSATAVSLSGGDTDNDSDVDINDVTLFLAQFGDLASDGGCPWDGTTRDADFSNNGAIGSEDYGFLTTNWLTSSTCSCTIGLNGGPDDSGPKLLTSISAAKLPADLAARADLNADGVVDYKDVRVFEKRHGLPNDLSSVMEASERKD